MKINVEKSDDGYFVNVLDEETNEIVNIPIPNVYVFLLCLTLYVSDKNLISNN